MVKKKKKKKMMMMMMMYNDTDIWTSWTEQPRNDVLTG